MSEQDNHNIPRQEAEAVTPQMVDFFHLTDEQRTNLQTAIAQSKGVVQVWVHSHYREEEAQSINKGSKLWDRYQNNRGRLIENRVKMNLPTIAFIESELQSDPEQREISKYAEYYKSSSNNSGEIYYVRTYNNDPTPCLSQAKISTVKKENWDMVADEFKKLGIEKLILSGEDYLQSIPLPLNEFSSEELTYANAHPETQVVEGRFSLPTHCVGNTLVNLSNRGIQISLSHATYPMIKQRPTQ